MRYSCSRITLCLPAKYTADLKSRRMQQLCPAQKAQLFSNPLSPLALTTHSAICSLSLGRRGYDVDVPSRAEHSTVTYALPLVAWIRHTQAQDGQPSSTDGVGVHEALCLPDLLLAIDGCWVNKTSCSSAVWRLIGCPCPAECVEH